MAITFGSNIGSASKGAFAVFPVNDSVGGATFDILEADVSTGAVVAVAGGVPLTANQAAALSSIFAKLIAGVPAGSVTGNELAFLQKLVGVLALTAGATITLSATGIGGNVWRLSASSSAAGECIVYVPNSAAEGFFVGAGSNGAQTPTVVPYDLFVPLDKATAPLAASYIFDFVTIGRNIKFGSSGAFRCVNAPTADINVDVGRSTGGGPFTAIATIEFKLGQNIGIWKWLIPSPRTAVPGDVISFSGPLVPDATFDGMWGTLPATVIPPI